MNDNSLMELLFPEVFVKRIDIREITPCTADPDRIKFLFFCHAAHSTIPSIAL